MAIIQFCCCWNSLRTGCFASAAYTMLYFSVTIIMVAIFGVVDENIDPLLTSESTEDPKTLQVLNIFVVTLSGFGLVSTSLLIYGLIQKMSWCLMPWIVSVSCTTLVDLIYAVYLLAHTESLNPGTALVFTCDFFLVIVNVYCILCVISQYQEYEEQHSASRRMVGLAVADELMDETHPPIVEFKLSDLQHHVAISVQQQQQHQDEQEPAVDNDEQSVMDVETCLWVDYRPNDDGDDKDPMAKRTRTRTVAPLETTTDRDDVGTTRQQPNDADDQQQQQQQKRRVTFEVASASSSS